MVTTITRKAATKITVSLASSPMPMNRITSGMRAMGGMVRMNWIQGSTMFLNLLYQPIKKANGIAARKASVHPARTRHSE